MVYSGSCASDRWDSLSELFDSSSQVAPNQLSPQVDTVKKHVALPAVVLTRKQQKQLSRLLLPASSSSSRPLLVFVNTKSGGQTGELLLYRLRSLLHENQVYDLLKDGGPKKGLDFFKDVPGFRVLVCGGDGSISWVLNEM